MTYATSYRPLGSGAEAGTVAAIKATARQFERGAITATEAIAIMRADGAYEIEILNALNWE